MQEHFLKTYNPTPKKTKMVKIEVLHPFVLNYHTIKFEIFSFKNDFFSFELKLTRNRSCGTLL